MGACRAGAEAGIGVDRMPACFPFGKSKAKGAFEEEAPADAAVPEEKSQVQKNATDIAVAEAKLKVSM